VTPEFSRPLRADAIGKAKRHPLSATADERVALAARFDLIALDALDADLEVRAVAGGVRVTGAVTATATQRCAVSGLPVPARVREAVELTFAQVSAGNADEEVELASADLDTLDWDGQALDLGEIVAETLGLALPPFPHADEAELAAYRAKLLSEEEAAAASNPFAVLRKTS
jgi:uncharacterized metal-binding protein YceD (DUF177 family)